MKTDLLKDSLGWGFALWWIGYLLGIAFFFVLPADRIGWVVLPLGVVITWWVLAAKIHSARLSHFLTLAIAWTALAVLLDYLLIVRLFHPPDGYYKADVYLYYALTFAMPPVAGWWKTSARQSGAQSQRVSS